MWCVCVSVCVDERLCVRERERMSERWLLGDQVLEAITCFKEVLFLAEVYHG